MVIVGVSLPFEIYFNGGLYGVTAGRLRCFFTLNSVALVVDVPLVLGLEFVPVVIGSLIIVLNSSKLILLPAITGNFFFFVTLVCGPCRILLSISITTFCMVALEFSGVGLQPSDCVHLTLRLAVSLTLVPD